MTGSDQVPHAPATAIPDAGNSQQLMSHKAAAPEPHHKTNTTIGAAALPAVASTDKETAPRRDQPSADALQQPCGGTHDVVPTSAPDRAPMDSMAPMESMAPMVAEQTKRLNEVRQCDHGGQRV